MTRLLEKGFGGRRAGNNHAQVVQALGRAIVEGRFLPGTLLPGDDELELTYGVSRTVLREAMKTLAAKGFLSVKTRVGTRVTDPLNWNYFDKEVLAWHVSGGMDADFRRNLAEVRRALEPGAAALAAERRTTEDLAAMRTALERMQQESQSEYAFAQADLALHLAIGAASQNPMMRSLASVIETALLEAFTLSPPTRERTLHAETVAAHARIVDCIEARDAGGASAAMLAVIDDGYQRVEAEKAGRP